MESRETRQRHGERLHRRRKIFTTSGRKGGQFIVALDVANQSELWTAKLGDKGGEPRCTPTIDGNLVYAVSTEGDLVCVQASDGKEVWRKSFATDFGNPPKPTWQFSESPLVDGEKLIVVPGSSEAVMVALNKKTGDVLWKCAADLPGKGHDGAGYTGAVISNAAGIRQYVTLVGKGAIGVDAQTGKLLWHYNRVANGTAVIPTPLVWDDYVFVSSGYGTGAALLKIVKGRRGRSCCGCAESRSRQSRHAQQESRRPQSRSREAPRRPQSDRAGNLRLRSRRQTRARHQAPRSSAPRANSAAAPRNDKAIPAAKSPDLP